MRSRATLLATAVACTALLAGCQQQVRDLEDVSVHEPDKAELYSNVDEYPNIARICIDGVAFATTTRDYQPILRVPEWDASFCGTQR